MQTTDPLAADYDFEEAARLKNAAAENRRIRRHCLDDLVTKGAFVLMNGKSNAEAVAAVHDTMERFNACHPDLEPVSLKELDEKIRWVYPQSSRLWTEFADHPLGAGQ